MAFTIREAGQAIGLCRSSIYNLAKAGKLPIRKVAGRSLILREDLESLLMNAETI